MAAHIEMKETTETKPLRYLTRQKLAVILLALAGIMGSGYWMSALGQPFNTGLFTIHKLLSVAGLVILTVFILRIRRAAAVTPDIIGGYATTGLLLISTMITGGVIAVSVEAPGWVVMSHKILPFFTSISTIITLFLMKLSQSE